MKIVISLDSWIIQDGNYGDFQVGDITEFALEFYPVDIRKHGDVKSITRRDHSTYTLNAEVIYIDNEAWVIDFGLKAFEEQKIPKGIKVGDFVSGEFVIGIDPFFYFENLKQKSTFPDITYKWKIDKIEMETTPLIETSPKYFERDKENESYIEVQKTDAWKDFDGNASYYLYCETIKS